MNAELLNKLRRLANMAAHLPYDVTLEDEDAAMRALHSELAADTVLELIALAEHSLSAQDGVLTKDRIREIFLANGFTIKDGCDDLKPYVYTAAEALLAAAAPSPAVAVGDQPKRQVFMDEIDAAKAGSEWLQPFFTPNFSLCFSVDEGARAPRAKWCMLFDSLDRVVAGYMLTRDAKNWTELTKISAATPPTSLAVRDVVDEPQKEQVDSIRQLIELHTQELDQNDYAYFELARTRRTDWMAWICTNLRDDDPERHVLAKGQGDTPDEACAAAVADYKARAAMREQQT